MQEKAPRKCNPKNRGPEKCKKMQSKIKKIMQLLEICFFGKHAQFQNLHFLRIFPIFFEFLQFLKFLSSNRRPSQKCKKWTIPEFAVFSHLLGIFSYFVCIFVEFFQFLNVWSSNRRPRQKCKKCIIPEFVFFVLAFFQFFVFFGIFCIFLLSLYSF